MYKVLRVERYDITGKIATVDLGLDALLRFQLTQDHHSFADTVAIFNRMKQLLLEKDLGDHGATNGLYGALLLENFEHCPELENLDLSTASTVDKFLEFLKRISKAESV